MTGQRYRLAILDDYQGVALEVVDWSVLDDTVDITVFQTPLGDDAMIAAALEPFDILCVLRERTPLPAVVIDRLPNLRLIASTGRRNAAIDEVAAGQRGIAVTHTDAAGHGAVEMTWAMILAAIRHIPDEVARMRSGGWQETLGGDLCGNRLGLVGVGTVGAAVAAIGRAFAMDVCAWSPNLTEERAAAAGVRLVSRDDLFRMSDIVSLHLVLSDRSRGIVGERELSFMKPDAWLVNSARGPLVDSGALVRCLTEKRIAGAAIDVYDHEPALRENPLRHLPNVLPTPHLGFVTRKSYEIFYGGVVQAVGAWIRDNPAA